MNKILIDSDVVIDFLTKREPFSIDSMKLIEYGRSDVLQISVSSLSINNVDYIIGRSENRKQARAKVKEILKLVEVLSVHRSTIESAAYSDFNDFEDAIQNFTAVENNIGRIVTRNVKDFVKSELSIQTPREFIRGFERNR